MSRFRYKVNLNYNPKHIKDLKTNIPKQLEIDTYNLSDIFIRPKNKIFINPKIKIL